MPIKEWKQLKEDLNEKAIYGLDTLVKDVSDEELNEDLIVYEGDEGKKKAEDIVKAYNDTKDINTKKCLYDAMNICLFQLYDEYTHGEYDRWKELDDIHHKWEQELKSVGELKEDFIIDYRNDAGDSFNNSAEHFETKEEAEKRLNDLINTDYDIESKVSGIALTDKDGNDIKLYILKDEKWVLDEGKLNEIKVDTLKEFIERIKKEFPELVKDTQSKLDKSESKSIDFAILSVFYSKLFNLIYDKWTTEDAGKLFGDEESMNPMPESVGKQLVSNLFIIKHLKPLYDLGIYDGFTLIQEFTDNPTEKEYKTFYDDCIKFGNELFDSKLNEDVDVEEAKEIFKNLVQNIASERIKDELKARQDYINDAKSIENAGKDLPCDCAKKIADISKDLAREENVHIGELEKVIDKVTKGDFLKNTESGHEEAAEELESGDINENLEEYYDRSHDDFVSRIESILDEAGIFYGDVVDYSDEGHVNIVGVDKEEQEEAQLALQDNFPKANITIPGDNYKEGEDDEIIVNYQISYPFKVWYNENRSEEELKSHELSDPNERCDEIIWVKASNKKEAEDKLNYNGDIFKWEDDESREDEINESKLTESTISELTPEQQDKFNSRIGELIRNFIVEQEALQENGLNRIRDTIRKEFNLTDFETKHVQLAMVRFMEMMRKTAEEEAEKVEDEIEDISKMD